MRVIFVGVHNKQYLTPLCSSTKTGKLIDRIINKLPTGIEVKKTNIFDVDELPEYYQMIDLANDWYYKNIPQNNDIIVLLGAIVHENFKFSDLKIIKLAHPASMWSHKNMDGYVDKAVLKIIDLIKKI